MLNAWRMAVRQLALNRRYALATMLVLGLSTGATMTVFTIVDSVVLRPLPFRAPDRLVRLWDTNAEKGVAHEPISPVNFLDYRALPVFADAAAWWRPAVNLTDRGLEPLRVPTLEVSSNLFAVLGVQPQIGPGFAAGGPLHVAGESVAVISDRLWRTRYHADPAIIGRQLQLNQEAYTVVGVMPPKFRFPDDIDLWQRLRWDLSQHSRDAHFMEAVARLAPARTIDQAQAACDALGLRLQSQFAATNAGWGSRLVPLLDEQLGYYRPALTVLFGAAGLLLVIGMLNVASLVLTRAVSRQREITVRVAVGATPRQLVGQLLAESLALSLGGALIGLAATSAAVPVLVRLAPVQIPRLSEAHVDWRALALCLAVVGATTLWFSVVPALFLLRRTAAAELKSGERGSSGRARRFYAVLVASEVAFAFALLVASALLIATVRRMTETPLGVDAARVVMAPIEISREHREDHASWRPAWQRVAQIQAGILEEIRQQPGIEAAGASNFPPLQVGWRSAFGIDGVPPPARREDAPQAQLHSVSEGYFEAMGARLVQGRAFGVDDGADAAPVVIVNDRFAHRYLTGRTPLGRTLRIFAGNIGPLGVNLKASDDPGVHHGMPFDVVGVIADVRNTPLGQAVEPAIYFSTRQFPFAEVSLAVRARSRGAAVAAIRRALHQVAPTVPLGRIQVWGERFDEQTAQPRLLRTTLTLFGTLAAVLTAIGMYGLFSWSVALRRRELAIRMTLGALPRGVLRLVLRQGGALVGLGLLGGALVVLGGEGLLRRVLYEVSPGDAASTTGAALVLVVASLGACIGPARRAMRIDPVEGLRAE